MPQIFDKSLIVPNNYYEVSVSKFVQLCNPYVPRLNKLIKSDYIVLVQCSPKTRSEPRGNIDQMLDLFSTDLIKKIKNDNLKVIFDCSFEGSSIYFPFADALHQTCEKHNIPFSNIHYLTGDALEKKTHQRKYPISINIYHINVLDEYTRTCFIADKKPALEKNCIHTFSCLNRKSRFWRARLVYKILSADLNKKALISHAKISSYKDIMGSNKFFDADMIDTLTANTPLILETEHHVDDFSGVFKDVYSKVMFDLSMETYQEGNQEYITEKTFKPMLSKVPVLIWGTVGMNTTALSNLGFKTYEDWFDLSFDIEPDTEKRMNLLMLELKRLVNLFDKMTIEERNIWSTKNLEVLKFNKNVIMNLLSTNRAEVMRLVLNLNFP